jgi:hypothetical protein
MSNVNAGACVLSIAIICVPLVMAPVYAQPTQQQSQTQEPAAGEQNESTDGQTEDGEADDSDQASEPPNIDTQPIQPGAGGPGRFIPSEQISQDLGVSFPIDI